MAKTVAVFLALLFVALASAARLTRDAPSQEPKDILKDVVAAAEKNVKEAADHIAKMLGLESAPSKDEVLDIIKVQYKTFADNAEKVGKEFEKELKTVTNTTVAEAYADISKKIQETVSTFRAQIESSGVAEKATELQGKFEEGIKNLVDEGKKLANKMEPQVNETGKELEKLTQELLNQASASMNELQDKIHNASQHSGH